MNDDNSRQFMVAPGDGGCCDLDHLDWLRRIVFSHRGITIDASEALNAEFAEKCRAEDAEKGKGFSLTGREQTRSVGSGLQNWAESGNLQGHGTNEAISDFLFFDFFFCDYGRGCRVGAGWPGGGWARGAGLGWGWALGAGRDCEHRDF